MSATPRPELSFDGMGINGPDEYRSRIATFATGEAARKYGPLFAAAPDLLASLREVMQEVGQYDDPAVHKRAKAAIAKATLRIEPMCEHIRRGTARSSPCEICAAKPKATGGGV